MSLSQQERAALLLQLGAFGDGGFRLWVREGLRDYPDDAPVANAAGAQAGPAQVDLNLEGQPEQEPEPQVDPPQQEQPAEPQHEQPREYTYGRDCKECWRQDRIVKLCTISKNPKYCCLGG